MIETLLTILIFLVVLSVLVLIHELGHFAAARLFGVHVEEFGIGFPPRARGWKRGKTLYSLNWLPLGGFVKLKGEQGEDAQDKDSFASKKIWQKLIILAAGVGMNLLLTILIFIMGFLFGTPQIIDEVQSGAHVRDEKIQITRVLRSSPAEKSGLRPGDTILSLNGEYSTDIASIQKTMRESLGTPVVVAVQRGGERVTFEITPKLIAESQAPGIGIALAHVVIVSYPPHLAVGMGVKATFVMAGNLFIMLGNAIRHLAFDSFVGPVGIAAYTATVTKLGFAYLLNLVAQLSLSLAIMNFLPIPALDGGRAFFIVIEKMRGKSLKPAFENAMHMFGFALLLLLLLLVTYRDVARLLPS